MNHQRSPGGVVTVTLNPTVDKTFRVDCLIPERKLEGQDLRDYPGGGGINVARVVARFGHDVCALWTRGGRVGGALADLLDGESLSHEPVPVAGDIRENLIVRDSASQQTYRFGLPGPELSSAERDLWLRKVAELEPVPEYLVLSGSLPPGVPAEWFAELIRSAPPGCRVVVDTKRAALLAAVEEDVFLIKPNIHELEEISERELSGEAEIARAAGALIDRGSLEAVLVSMGRGGALLVTADGSRSFSAPPVPLKSKVGAGDSMVGGMVTALVKQWSMSDAARFSVAAGTATVMTAGTELCRPKDTERLYEQIR